MPHWWAVANGLVRRPVAAAGSVGGTIETDKKQLLVPSMMPVIAHSYRPDHQTCIVRIRKAESIARNEIEGNSKGKDELGCFEVVLSFMVALYPGWSLAVLICIFRVMVMGRPAGWWVVGLAGRGKCRRELLRWGWGGAGVGFGPEILALRS